MPKMWSWIMRVSCDRIILPLRGRFIEYLLWIFQWLGNCLVIDTKFQTEPCFNNELWSSWRCEWPRTQICGCYARRLCLDPQKALLADDCVRPVFEPWTRPGRVVKTGCWWPRTPSNRRKKSPSETEERKVSRIRESNPPPWLGKPMHYRCANPAKCECKHRQNFCNRQ